MKKHIFIVDDEAPVRNLLAEFLISGGYRVTSLESAIEAQQVFKKDRPDLIITDLQLEDSDGLDMVDQIKTLLPDAPVILLTGVFFDPQVVRDVLSKRVSSYLQKPSSLAKILEEVQRLIGT